METRAKKKTFNIIMVVLIALIVVCGVMLTGHIKGWFGDKNQSGMTCSETTGVVNVERSGVGYSLEADVSMEPGDIVETKSGSEAVFAVSGGNNLSVNEKTEIEVPSCQKESLKLVLNNGEFFADVPSLSGTFDIDFGKNAASIDEAVFSVSQQGVSSTLTVYEGIVSVKSENGDTNKVKAGKQILITRNANDKLTVDISKVKASSLSDYMIGKLLACKTDGLCFSADELNKVTADREKEKAEAAKALEREAIEIASSEEASAQTEDGSGSSGAGNSNSSAGDKDGSSGNSGSSDIMTCTISIRCTSILNNMDKLKSGKERYVPSNGIILATSSIEFRKGESAYDVTKRACSATGIQIEASYTPIYDGYYVEGINHLYEFDCGQMSGWLYKVNGWAPNYGCSQYTVKNGDSIVWDYTCTGN